MGRRRFWKWSASVLLVLLACVVLSLVYKRCEGYEQGRLANALELTFLDLSRSGIFPRRVTFQSTFRDRTGRDVASFKSFEYYLDSLPGQVRIPDHVVLYVANLRSGLPVIVRTACGPFEVPAGSLDLNLLYLHSALWYEKVVKGDFPKHLVALAEGSNPYIQNRSVLVDPWGRRFAYTKTEKGYRLRSLGGDGVESSDDIVIPVNLSRQHGKEIENLFLSLDAQY